ncbi:MAG TPA: OsmC family protein, partial [Pedococcus sp.]|nr:OsmC family protein [Pedococcus sp.]
PVELLLTAIAGCTAVDVDFITVKRAEPETFTVAASGEKLKDGQGNHMGDLQVTFSVTFPEGEAGDRAREMLPKALAMSHDRLCTVSRTVELGTPVDSRLAAD